MFESRTTACQQHKSSVTNRNDKAVPFIQPKLSVNQPGDEYEREADEVAERVMRMPAQNDSFFSPKSMLFIQRKCAACEEEETLQRKENASSVPEVSSENYSYISSLSSRGNPLPDSSRKFFEPRFDHDFSWVRIHNDSHAHKSARDVNALAYTHGSNIVFGANQFSPESHSGKKLIAHELTHVVQQQHGRQAIQRDIVDWVAEGAEEFGKQRLRNLAAEPLGPPTGFTGPPGCPPNFCQPFTSKLGAAKDLTWAGPLILAGIAKKVNSRVVPLWTDYLTGGSSTKNLSTDFAADFTESPTTYTTTRFLKSELTRFISANRKTLMGGKTTATFDFTSALAPAVKAIDDPASVNQMNFNYPADIAGNIAGGIGKDQTAHLIGARPSPFNDTREAKITATLVSFADGSIYVAPSISFKVWDTIDLCPGNCGTVDEQVATIPLSRFEATGLTGDVPMVIEFGAPTLEMIPFLIPAPAVP